MSATMIEVFNPANGEKIGETKSHNAEEAREAIKRAKKAQKHWEAIGVDERIRVIRRFKDILLDRAEEMSEAIARENGKVLQEALEMEVFPVADLAAYFSGRVKDLLAPHKIPLHLLKHRRSYIHHRPRGVVLIISPWNFPFAIPFGTVLMSLLAGNAVILKPASLTPLIALKGRELFDEAGLDADLFQVIPCPGKVGSEMIHMDVDYVQFTGSTEVGRKVYETCGGLLMPCAMELGGKDPAIVLPDADLDIAAGGLVWGAFANAGQVCAAVERVYIHETIFDELCTRITERTKQLRVGDPLLDGTDVGPMTDPSQIEIVARQVEDAVRKGAKVHCGGKRLDGPGRFFAPTVLTDVTDDMDVIKNETFGPLLPLMKYATVDEAIERANDSSYGLDAYVFGRDARETRRVAERLEAGTVMINETLITHAMPETPWGGVKNSGVGHVHSDEGLKQLCIPYHVNEEVVPTLKKNPFWYPYSHAKYHAFVAMARAVDHGDLTAKVRGAADLVGSAWRMLRS